MNRYFSGGPSTSLILIALIALGLRLWDWHLLEISEFDQGVYSASAQSLSRFERPYPGVQFQAPPGYYGLGALLTLLTGLPAHRVLLLISLLAGVATVLLTGIAGTLWFNRRAGAVAAALLAISDFHIQFSREAFTDASYTFCFLLALFVGGRALDSGRVSTALLAGCAVGVAWEFKVHGWFAIVVLAFATAVDYIRARDSKTLLSRSRTLGIMSIVAGILYLPGFVLILLGGGLQSYRDVMRGFLSDDYLGALASYWVIAKDWNPSVSAALVFLGLLAPGSWETLRRPARPVMFSTLLSTGTLAFGLSRALVVTAPFATTVLWRSRGLGGPIVLSSLALWMASLPLYRPYSRLLLPLLVTAALAIGALFSHVWQQNSSSVSLWAPAAAAAVVISLLVAGHFAWLPAARPSETSPWRSSDLAAVAARRIQRELPRDALVLNADSPPVAYYLMLARFPVHVVRHKMTAVPARQAWLVSAGTRLDTSSYHGSLVAPLLPFATPVWTIGERRHAITLYRIDPR